jgi:hypothetical protein
VRERNKSSSATHGDHEGDVLEVAAEDLELRSGRGQGRLLDVLHQHVQQPQLLLLLLVDEDLGPILKIFSQKLAKIAENCDHNPWGQFKIN